MLTWRQPIWIGWGPELIFFYNDPYQSIIGGKHPAALGLPAAAAPCRWRRRAGHLVCRWPALPGGRGGRDGAMAGPPAGRHQFEARPPYGPGGSSRIEVTIR